MNIVRIFAATILLVSAFLLPDVCGQTSVFLYQGRLNDGGNAANGTYDMQFKLFDTLAGGVQVGVTQTNAAVTVTTGVFAVSLDFGPNAFTGAGRYLEVAVRPAGNPNAHTVLSPRTQILTSPYSIRSNTSAVADTAANALSLGGLPANQFVQTNDPRLSDARNPLPNSGNYIQNTVSTQPSSNFNISGSGTVGSLNANGPFSLGGVAAPAVAPAGQGRIFFDIGTNKFRISENGGAFVDMVGSNGVSGSGAVNSLPLWSAGTTLGNSAVSQFGSNIGIGTGFPTHRLAVVGGPAWTGDAWGGALELENASAIAWRQNTSGVKFGIGRTESGLFFFRTNSPLGTTTNAPIYDFKMDNSGNVGVGPIGINTDLSGARFNVFTAATSYGITHTDSAITVGTQVGGRTIAPVVAAGGWIGTRSNHPFYLFTNDARPAITVDTTSRVGIGTTTPAARLQVAAGSEVGISVTSSGNALIGTTPTPGFAAIFGENTSLSGGSGVYGKGASGHAVYAEGHAGQSRDKGGIVKAMAYVNESGAIVRCFNSFNTSPVVANCGFTTSHTLTGRYVINFGFAVSDRFVVTEGHGFNASHSYGAGLGNANAIEVFMVDFTNTLREGPFTIVVF